METVKSRSILLAVSAALATSMLLAACQSSEPEKEWVKPDSITLGCEDYLSIATPFGMITNNVWNKHAAADKKWRQCVERREVDGQSQYGWSWSWPTGKRVIYAYPQIKLGISPWDPEPKMDDRFPLKIASLDNFTLSYDVEITTNGQHNLATTMWLTHSPYVGTEPNTSVIAAEIMIWTYATAKHFDPAGKKYGDITVDGMEWEVWFVKEWGDGVNKNKWVNVTFKAKKQMLTANIPLLKLLQYAMGNNLITKDLYVADIELGNEIMSGAGLAWVKSFNVSTDAISHPSP